MRDIRIVGDRIKNSADSKGVSIKSISDGLGISENMVELGLAGRIMFSYHQLQKLADILDVPITDLINTSKSDYSMYAIDCMNDFSKQENREDILDMIYDYLDVVDSLS